MRTFLSSIYKGSMKKLFWFLTLFSLSGSSFQKVDINTAIAAQIAVVPGIGETLARKIVDYRDRFGPFHNDQGLSKVAGMTPKKLAQMRGHIVFSEGKKKDKEKFRSPPVPAKMPWHPRGMLALAELESIALEQAQLSRNYENQLVKNSKHSGLIPKISLELDVGQNQAASGTRSTSQVDARQTRNGQALGFGIKASFDLPRLLFSDSILDIAQLGLKREAARSSLIQELHKSYFRYLRVAQQMASESPGEAYQLLSFELDELKATLDSKSGGAFGRALIPDSAQLAAL
jgi:competence ComEA-like helix-hairpin-helix protein